MKSLFLTLGLLFSVQVSAATTEELFEKFDEYCSGNEVSHMYEHEIENVDLQKAVTFAKKSDRDGSGVDCTDGRAYPTKQKTILKAFKERFSDTCSTEFTSKERSELMALFTDESNLAVSASLYAGNDNPEACDYDNYFIFQADGTLINFTFNETD